jgi:hypothetical protein
VAVAHIGYQTNHQPWHVLAKRRSRSRTLYRHSPGRIAQSRRPSMPVTSGTLRLDERLRMCCQDRRGPRSCGLRWCFHPERGAVSTPCERSSSAWNRTCTLPTTVLREPFLRHPQQQKVPGRGTGRRSFPAHFPPTGQGEHSCDAKYTQLYKWPGQHKEPIWPRRPWNRGRSRREPREERTSPGCARSLKNPAARVYASFRAHTWCVGRYGTFLALTSALVRCAQQSEISLRVCFAMLGKRFAPPEPHRSHPSSRSLGMRSAPTQA